MQQLALYLRLSCTANAERIGQKLEICGLFLYILTYIVRCDKAGKGPEAESPSLL